MKMIQKIKDWYRERITQQRNRSNQRLAICSHCQYRKDWRCSVNGERLKTFVEVRRERCPKEYW